MQTDLVLEREAGQAGDVVGDAVAERDGAADESDGVGVDRTGDAAQVDLTRSRIDWDVVDLLGQCGWLRGSIAP